MTIPAQTDHTAAVQAHYAALTALVAEAQTAPHMVYMGEVVAMAATTQALLGALLAGLGILTPEGDPHGDDAHAAVG